MGRAEYFFQQSFAISQEPYSFRESWADFWMLGLPVHNRYMGLLFYFVFFYIIIDYLGNVQEEEDGTFTEDFLEGDYFDYVNYSAYASGLNVTDLSEDWDLTPENLEDDNDPSLSTYYHEDLFEDWIISLDNHDDEQLEGEEDDFQVDIGYDGPDLVTEWDLDAAVDDIHYNFRYSSYAAA